MDFAKETQRHSQVTQLFLLACELPLPQRLELLRLACISDETIRHEVSELLRYDRPGGEELPEEWLRSLSDPLEARARREET